jgi:hypothetical protein
MEEAALVLLSGYLGRMGWEEWGKITVSGGKIIIRTDYLQNRLSNNN